MESNVELSKSALVNTMGLDWNSPLDVSETDIPYNPHQIDLGLLVSNTYEFSPDWARLQAGLTAAGAKVGEAKSGYFPKMGLVGSLNYIVNTYDSGLVTPGMKKSWMIGIGVEVPIFNGFMNSGKVGEAKARLAKLEKQQILLKEGLALQVKHLFLQLKRAKDQQDASKAAMEAAEQNRDLNVRAYQDVLVETQDVIESQLMESFMIAQYQKILYDHIETQAKLDFIIGEEVRKLLK
jgi:outer membrane protein TolC